MMKKPRSFIHRKCPGESLYHLHVALANGFRHRISSETTDHIRGEVKPGINSRHMIV